MYMSFAEAGAHERDRIDRRAREEGRVDADHACDAAGMVERHRPHDAAAPVVPAEHRLFDSECIEQARKIAGQMRHVVVDDFRSGRDVPP